MKMLSIEEELKNNSYPGRGIVIGKTQDGTKAVTAYFIMGRSENSRNRVFVKKEKESVHRRLIRQNWKIRALLFMRRCVSSVIKRLLQTEIRQILSMKGWISR